MKRATLIAALVVSALGAHAQKLGESRQVFRCERNGKVTYTDEPCIGATEVDVTPTKGMETHQGANQRNPEYMNKRAAEMRREGIANALQPITGMDQATLERSQRRMRLAPAVREECDELDRSLSRLQQGVQRQTDAASETKRQRELFEARKRFKDLKCW